MNKFIKIKIFTLSTYEPLSKSVYLSKTIKRGNEILTKKPTKHY